MESTEGRLQTDTYFKDDELSGIELRNPDGLSSGEIIDILTDRGFKFSEATLRKYVQLGLLPRSRRVGSKGKHKGSRGLYPAGTIRQINEIKCMMAQDCTIEQIRSHFVFVGGEIEELRTLTERILEKLEEGLRNHSASQLASSELRLQIESVRSAGDDLLRKVESSATRIKRLGELAREAV
jgi:hypothetical protein